MANWKPIEGHPGYQVSDEGHVKKSSYVKIYEDGTEFFYPEKVLTEYVYDNVVCVNFHKQARPIHRLVAEAFLTKDDKCYYVKHKDGDVTNNSVSNLEYVLASDEVKQAIAEGRRSAPKSYTGVAIRCVETGKMFESIAQLCSFTGVSRYRINRAIQNHTAIDGKTYEVVK